MLQFFVVLWKNKNKQSVTWFNTTATSSGHQYNQNFYIYTVTEKNSPCSSCRLLLESNFIFPCSTAFSHAVKKIVFLFLHFSTSVNPAHILIFLLSTLYFILLFYYYFHKFISLYQVASNSAIRKQQNNFIFHILWHIKIDKAFLVVRTLIELSSYKDILGSSIHVQHRYCQCFCCLNSRCLLKVSGELSLLTVAEVIQEASRSF